MPISVNTPWGQPAIFPDGTPDDEMRSALDSLALEQQGRQQFQALPAIAQAAQNAFADVSGFQPYEIPVVPGNSFGLSSQQMQQTQNTIQQTQQMNAGEAIRQRAERDKALEAEKDRSRQFQLEQMRFKNEAGLKQFEADKAFERAKWSAEQDIKKPINIPGVGLYLDGQIVEGTAPPPNMKTFTGADGQVYNVSEDGKYTPVPGIRGYVPRQGGGGGGTRAPIFRDIGGLPYRYNPDSDSWTPAVGPDGKPISIAAAEKSMSMQDIRDRDQIVADYVFQEGSRLGAYNPDGSVVPGMEGILEDLSAQKLASIQAETSRGAAPQSASAPAPQDEDTLESLLITDIPITGAPATPTSPVAPPVDWADPDAIWKAVAPYVAPAPPPQPVMPQFPPLLGQNNVLYR